MKALGIIRPIDDLGRVSIPVEVRRSFNLTPGSKVEMFTENDILMMKKYNPGCSICGEDNYIEIDGIRLCKNCLNKFNKLK